MVKGIFIILLMGISLSFSGCGKGSNNPGPGKKPAVKGKNQVQLLTAGKFNLANIQLWDTAHKKWVDEPYYSEYFGDATAAFTTATFLINDTVKLYTPNLPRLFDGQWTLQPTAKGFVLNVNVPVDEMSYSYLVEKLDETTLTLKYPLHGSIRFNDELQHLGTTVVADSVKLIYTHALP